MDQNRDPQNRPNKYNHLICEKKIKKSQFEKDFFSTNGAITPGKLHGKRKGI